MIENRKFMPSLLDREISSAEDDAFGHRHFAKALESLIESPENEPPFSVGLLGKWGTGKSSIKEMYLQSRRDDRTKNKKGKIRSERFHTISFNAWLDPKDFILSALMPGDSAEKTSSELYCGTYFWLWGERKRV
jgi:predicted KAP-like P-loop ATPase